MQCLQVIEKDIICRCVNTETNTSNQKFLSDFILMHPGQKKSLQAMTPEQKLKVALDLHHSAIEIKTASLKSQHPDWTMDTIKEKVREIFLYARA